MESSARKYSIFFFQKIFARVYCDGNRWTNNLWKRSTFQNLFLNDLNCRHCRDKISFIVGGSDSQRVSTWLNGQRSEDDEVKEKSVGVEREHSVDERLSIEEKSIGWRIGGVNGDDSNISLRQTTREEIHLHLNVFVSSRFFPFVNL